MHDSSAPWYEALGCSQKALGVGRGNGYHVIESKVHRMLSGNAHTHIPLFLGWSCIEVAMHPILSSCLGSETLLHLLEQRLGREERYRWWNWCSGDGRGGNQSREGRPPIRCIILGAVSTQASELCPHVVRILRVEHLTYSPLSYIHSRIPRYLPVLTLLLLHLKEIAPRRCQGVVAFATDWDSWSIAIARPRPRLSTSSRSLHG